MPTSIALHLRTAEASQRLHRLIDQIAPALPVEEWTLFAMQVGSHQLAPGDVLVRSELMLDHHYWIDEGLLCASVKTPHGDEVTVDIVSQGDFFISYAAVDREEAPRMTVTAEAPTYCLTINHSLMTSSLQRNRVWDRVYRYMAEQTAARHEIHLLDVLKEDGPTRWQRFLLDHTAILDTIPSSRLESYLGLSATELAGLRAGRTLRP